MGAVKKAEPGEHFTQAELAARWKISERTLEDWRHKRRGPKYQNTGRVLYALEDILEYERIKSVKTRDQK
jgi:DNA-binding transcriptional regulator YiaG